MSALRPDFGFGILDFVTLFVIMILVRLVKASEMFGIFDSHPWFSVFSTGG